MTPGFLRSAVILGLLSCVGPFAIDMYLPALPKVATELDGTIAAAQMTITSYFIAFGVVQIFYGPLSDMYGRKPPLLVGLVLFIIGSLGCAFAPDVSWLIAARFLQGLGGAAVMVIPRAIIRDMHTGTQATRLMALVMLVISVSPMLAPLAGSGLIAISDWRLIFLVLAFVAVLSILMTLFLQPETLAPEHRVPVSLKAIGRGAKTLFTDPVFMGLTFVGGFGMASFFVFLASASFVYTGFYGLTPVGFSLAFAINALGFFAASQFAAGLGERFGLIPMLTWAVSGFLGATLMLLALVLAGFDQLGVVILMLILANACLGLVIPTTMVMALDDHGDIAGLASSLGGMLQMFSGGLMVALVGPFFDGTPVPMVAAIAICAVIAFILMRLTISARLRTPVLPV
ncbi:DHA1 family bicyclomycin/chloramphenicol resistance-like MFS transporter [Hoeflea marina]|uniref:Bcr/CflA family efflux transporter n=1 Tax=Hoeflea marina TaxID=274592 RepID=A0A317PMS4_9HYPH|nr:multidrug effflux MFS transporter [Hoeflea marina]PWW01358.1 DHA1 family bicyclomycin/chloramphenicol resistance-like MFS transporter [Hoeflea marina]